jgi:hypothetical protein
MSLDDRLRIGLHEAADMVRPDVEAGLTAARRSAARRRTVRLAALAAAVVAVLGVAVPLGTGLLGRDDGVTASRLTDADARRLLRDTWVTPVVTRAAVVQTLSDAGLDQHAGAVLLSQAYPTAWNLQFTGDRYTAASAAGVQADVGRWDVVGDTLVLRPEQCPCTLRFRWTLTEGRLLLELTSDDSPATDGVPDEAYARALYTTVPFTRFAATP